MAKVLMNNGQSHDYNTVLLVELTGSEANEIFGTHKLPLGRDIPLNKEVDKLRRLRGRFIESPDIAKQLRAMAELLESVTPRMVDVANGPKEEEEEE